MYMSERCFSESLFEIAFIVLIFFSVKSATMGKQWIKTIITSNVVYSLIHIVEEIKFIFVIFIDTMDRMQCGYHLNCILFIAFINWMNVRKTKLESHSTNSFLLIPWLVWYLNYGTSTAVEYSVTFLVSLLWGLTTPNPYSLASLFVT